MSNLITVIAKKDAGWHRIHGQIIGGKTYRIKPEHYSSSLFRLPCADPAPAATATTKPASKKKRS